MPLWVRPTITSYTCEKLPNYPLLLHNHFHHPLHIRLINPSLRYHFIPQCFCFIFKAYILRNNYIGDNNARILKFYWQLIIIGLCSGNPTNHPEGKKNNAALMHYCLSKTDSWLFIGIFNTVNVKLTFFSMTNFMWNASPSIHLSPFFFAS